MVACNTHLRVDIVLEAVVVTVEVVGSDIHQHTDICPKVEHAVELETAQLKYIPIVLCRSNAIGKRLADIATQSDIKARIGQYFIYK